VQQTAAPIQTKVDQVADQANKQGSPIDEHGKHLDSHKTGINAAKESALSDGVAPYQREGHGPPKRRLPAVWHGGRYPRHLVTEHCTVAPDVIGSPVD